MPSKSTPQPPTQKPGVIEEDPERSDHPASPAAVAKEVRDDVFGAPGSTLVLPPAFDVQAMDEEMQAFLRTHAEKHEEVDPLLQDKLLKHYGGFGRALNRYLEILRAKLRPKIAEMLERVRQEIPHDEVTAPYMDHLARIERPLFAMAEGIHTHGLPYVMDTNLGMHTPALAEGLERILGPMDEQSHYLRQFFEDQRILGQPITEDQPFESLAEALNAHLNGGSPLPVREKLAALGITAPSILKKFLTREVQSGSRIAPGTILINPEVYARTEQAMHLSIDGHLLQMSSQPLLEQSQIGAAIAREILAFIKFTQLNRWRVAKQYLPLITPSERSKRRPIDNVREPLEATDELLQILHITMHLMRSEAHQKNTCFNKKDKDHIIA